MTLYSSIHASLEHQMLPSYENARTASTNRIYRGSSKSTTNLILYRLNKCRIAFVVSQNPEPKSVSFKTELHVRHIRWHCIHSEAMERCQIHYCKPINAWFHLCRSLKATWQGSCKHASGIIGIIRAFAATTSRVLGILRESSQLLATVKCLRNCRSFHEFPPVCWLLLATEVSLETCLEGNSCRGLPGWVYSWLCRTYLSYVLLQDLWPHWTSIFGVLKGFIQRGCASAPIKSRSSTWADFFCNSEARELQRSCCSVMEASIKEGFKA